MISNSKFNSITVVSIYGHSDGSEAIPALVKSFLELPGSSAMLISLAKPAHLPPEVQWKKILSMNYRQYSLFVMFCLHNFIETEFCLIVQQDGWVINGKNFQNIFFEFDYIGAPCNWGILDNKLVKFNTLDFRTNATLIQNGGFSLRSRKYLRAPSLLGAIYLFNENTIMQNEDIQLTGIYKNLLTDNGIKFAPYDVAKKFSFEYAIPNYHDDVCFENIVGIHGQTRKLIDQSTIYTTPEAYNLYREKELLNFLENKLNYRIVTNISI